MSFDADEEILQDFLVEAGEILEVLSEQLVELENRPDDANLLNAIFRGFHTVKGGAGFLQLEPLVELCHAAENVFDLLRNNKLSVTSELMDVVLQSLDAVNSMFAQVNGRAFPEPADPSLMDALHAIINGESPAAAAAHEDVYEEEAETADAAPEADAQGDITDEEFEQLLGALDQGQPAASTPSAPAASGGGDIELFGEDEEVQAAAGSSDEITEDEFEALLDQLHGKGKKPGAAAAPEPAQAAKPAATAGGSDEITDDEFEALLDELHGKGKHGGTPKTGAEQPAAAATPAAASGASGDLITDDEFESLLDQLHGKGKGPTAGATKQEQPPAPKAEKPAAKPAAKSEPKPAAKSEPKPAAKPAPKPVAAAKAASDTDDEGEDRRAGAARGGAAAAAAPKEAAAENTVRVDTKRLDDIMNMVGELVLRAIAWCVCGCAAPMKIWRRRWRTRM
ncbi:MAG: Hpt domain-containing protein [Gammaproteobacteria bacterium]